MDVEKTQVAGSESGQAPETVSVTVPSDNGDKMYAVKLTSVVEVTKKMIKNLLTRANVEIDPLDVNIDVVDNKSVIFISFNSKEECEEVGKALGGNFIKKEVFSY